MTGNERSVSGKDEGFAYTVPTVDRAVRILLMLSAEEHGMTLCRHEFLERDASTKRYALGIQLAHCGKAVLKNLQVNRSAKLFLRELSDFSGETTNLAVLRGTKMVIVDVVEPPAALVDFYAGGGM